MAPILRVRYTTSVLSVIPNTKQRRNPLFRASISGGLPRFQLFILWHTISAHPTSLLQALIFQALQIKLTLCRLTIETMPRIFLITMPEEKARLQFNQFRGKQSIFCPTSRRWDLAELPVKYWEEYLELATPELAHFTPRLFSYYRKLNLNYFTPLNNPNTSIDK